MNIPRDKLIWRQVPYLRIGETGRYEFELKLPEPLASWDVWDRWEQERIRHMVKNLNQGDILFDIGAEMGWMSVVFASMVHPSNMVLIEPTPEFWPNIEAIWHKNLDCEPLATYAGLFSDKTTSNKVLPMQAWPDASKQDLIDKLAYKYIHDNEGLKTPEITLDEYVKQTGIVPDALTMDTEGSELLILKGAKNTLARRNLKVWVSIHDELAKRDYGVEPGETIKFMKEQGYKHEIIATDHEMHTYFWRG